jgi:hypothetical protein
MDIKKLTQHERVVYFRAKRLRLTVKEYSQKFGSKNLSHLLA